MEPVYFVNNVAGPFDLLKLVGPVAVPVHSLPYAQVRGGHIAISVEDSINVAGIASVNSIFVADVEVFGIVKGIETLLKKGFVRSFTGPMVIRFEDSDAYQTVEIRARNMAGGKQPAPSLAIMAETTQSIFNPLTGGGSGTPAIAGGLGTQTLISNNFVATISITVQPRYEARKPVGESVYG